MTTAAIAPQQPIARIVGSIEPKSVLIVVSNGPGAAWSRGAHLGEEVGLVVSDHYYVGSIYAVSWLDGYVIASEYMTKVPETLRPAYAKAIMDKIQPTRVALLDEYLESAYQPPAAVAPIRYLSNSNFNPGTRAEPFAPPNKIENTSTALMSAHSPKTTSRILFLLPSTKIDKADRVTVHPGDSHAMDNTNMWSKQMMQQVNDLLLDAVGEGRREWG